MVHVKTQLKWVNCSYGKRNIVTTAVSRSLINITYLILSSRINSRLWFDLTLCYELDMLDIYCINKTSNTTGRIEINKTSLKSNILHK